MGISTQITLDGVMTVGEWFNQHGEHDGHGSAGQASLDQLRAADAFILGHRTYEGLAAVWPTISDDVGFADRVNSQPKFACGGQKVDQQPILRSNNSSVVVVQSPRTGHPMIRDDNLVVSKYW